jgi:hypothetical protein
MKLKYVLPQVLAIFRSRLGFKAIDHMVKKYHCQFDLLDCNWLAVSGSMYDGFGFQRSEAIAAGSISDCIRSVYLGGRLGANVIEYDLYKYGFVEDCDWTIAHRSVFEAWSEQTKIKLTWLLENTYPKS